MIEALQNENRLLKERLDEAGISYADIAVGSSNEHSDIYDPDQGARIKRFEVTDKIAKSAICVVLTKFVNGLPIFLQSWTYESCG